VRWIINNKPIIELKGKPVKIPVLGARSSWKEGGNSFFLVVFNFWDIFITVT